MCGVVTTASSDVGRGLEQHFPYRSQASDREQVRRLCTSLPRSRLQTRHRPVGSAGGPAVVSSSRCQGNEMSRTALYRRCVVCSPTPGNAFERLVLSVRTSPAEAVIPGAACNGWSDGGTIWTSALLLALTVGWPVTSACSVALVSSLIFTPHKDRAEAAFGQISFSSFPALRPV
jgi:hypothetical protein